MKVFEFAGVIFNADNVCTIQKITMRKEPTKEGEVPEAIPGLQIVTIGGGVNFSFTSEKERDEKFVELSEGIDKL